jgi:hypothetical protein
MRLYQHPIDAMQRHRPHMGATPERIRDVVHGDRPTSGHSTASTSHVRQRHVHAGSAQLDWSELDPGLGSPGRLTTGKILR